MTELQDLQQQIAEVGRRAAEVQERMDRIRPTATSPDGAVKVSVTANGTLQGIAFGAAARSMDLDALAAAILRTAGEAHRVAAVQMQAALADLTGPDSAPVREMGQYIPPPDDAVTTSATDVPATRPAHGNDTDDDGFTGRGRA